ncbi:MAG TPA: hypothetical protein VGL28_04040 [Steroidobacteraceae bacterium]
MKFILIQTAAEAGAGGADARRALRRELGWLLLVKLLALALLWALFFSAPHRPAVDASGTGRQLAVGATP